MNHGTKRCRIGAVVAAMMILVATVAAAGSRGELESIERDLGDYHSVRLSAGSIKIEVSEAQGGSRLEATLDNRRNLDVTEESGRVVVRVSRAPRFGTLGMQEIIRLFVPAGVQAEIDSGSGSVEITGVDFSELTVDVGSGSISISRSQASMKIDIGSGSVELTDVAGEFIISSGSGSISGTGVTLTGDSLFDTGSGRVEMAFLNRMEELTFDLDSGSGSIRVDDIRDADRVIIGSGDIKVSGSTGSGSQEYRTR